MYPLLLILSVTERGLSLFLWRNLSGILIDNQGCSQFPPSLVNLELQYLSSKNCEITETSAYFYSPVAAAFCLILAFHTAYAQLGTAKYLEGKLHMEYWTHFSEAGFFQEPRLLALQILGALIALHFLQISTVFNQPNF